MDQEDIARVGHEVNRAYCAALGDLSQAPWSSAPDWQRQSAIAGVKFVQANPHLGPEASHENQLAEKAANGWIWGPEKDEVARTHPCIKPYDDLPVEQKAKDYMFKAVAHALTDWECV